MRIGAWLPVRGDDHVCLVPGWGHINSNATFSWQSIVMVVLVLAMCLHNYDFFYMWRFIV